MKKYLLYITTLIASFLVTSCLDDPFLEGCPEENNVPVQLTLSFSGSGPMSRDVTSSDETLDYTTDPQSAMIQDDVYVLVIDANDGEILYMIEDLEISNAGNGRYHDKVLRGTMQQTAVGETVKLVVLANLDQNQLTNALGDEISDVNAYLKSKVKTSTANGAKISTIYNDLIYNYSAVSTNDGESTSTPWNLDNRRIPMWGQTVATTVPANGMELDCFLYRAIAKVNIWINNKEGIKDSEGNFKFSINKITINNVNKQGYCAYVDESSTTKQPSSDITVQYTLPKEPAGVQQQDGIVYNDLNVTTSYSDMIYLPEQDNTGKAEGYTPVEMIVEYTYNGDIYNGVDDPEKPAGIIRFEDNKGLFDVIRNHSYIFNVTKESEELGLNFTVAIEKWDETEMQGISGQYTLRVDQDNLNFNGFAFPYHDVTVKTDYINGWEVVHEYNENGERTFDWFEVINPSSLSGSEDAVTIKPTPNLDDADREGYFYIQAGVIKKKIVVRQERGETANCYLIVQPGTYALKVDVKGNGEKGESAMTSEDGSSGETKLWTSDIEGVEKVAVIWETTKGLVTITPTAPNTVGAVPNDAGCIDYTVTDDSSIWQTGKGGNALIGAFDADNNVLWSWHIWVVADYRTTGIRTENWITNYDFIDRNLGATSNQPGIESLGLLYQWGRKDPFIGAGSIQNATKADVVWYTSEGTEEGTNKVYPGLYKGELWSNLNGNSIADVILYPTYLSSTGMLTSSHVNNQERRCLWGAQYGNITTEDAGKKTLWDPCPPGYRVPAIHAWVFKNTYRGNEYSCYTSNWSYNLTFVPNNMTGYTPEWDNPNTAGSANYINNNDVYGFWINFRSNIEKPSVGTYSEGTDERTTSPETDTWVPLSGVYSGNIGNFANVDGFSSLKVNSILWLNSPVPNNVYQNNNSNFRPSGVFLHGTEGNGGQRINGRHIHKLNEATGNLLAKPDYAGAVRCVRDDKAIQSSSNEIENETVYLGGNNGSTTTTTITAYEGWEIIDPGASWVSMNPEEETVAAQTSKTTTLTFTANQANETGAERSTTIKIRFNRGDIKTIRVVQYTKEVVTIAVNPNSFIWSYNQYGTAVQQDFNVSVSSGDWTYVTTGDTDQFTITKSGNTLAIYPNTATESVEYDMSITITSTEDTSKSCTLTLKQAKQPTTLDFIGDDLVIGDGKSLEWTVGETTEKQATLVVAPSSIEWTATPTELSYFNVSWSDNVVTASPKENAPANAAETITVRSSDGVETTLTLKVVPQETVIKVYEGENEVSGLAFGDNKSHTITISIEPEQAVELRVAGRYEVNKNYDGTYTITYNGWGVLYSGTLTISAADGTTKTITLSEN